MALPPLSQRGATANQRLLQNTPNEIPHILQQHGKEMPLSDFMGVIDPQLFKQTSDEIWRIFQQRGTEMPLSDFMDLIDPKDPEKPKVMALLPIDQLQQCGLTDFETLPQVLAEKHKNKGALKSFIAEDAVFSRALYLYDRSLLERALNAKREYQGFLGRCGLLEQGGDVNPDRFALHISQVDYETKRDSAKVVLIETYLELPAYESLLNKYIPKWDGDMNRFSDFVGENRENIRAELGSLKTKCEGEGQTEKIAELEKLNELMEIVLEPGTPQDILNKFFECMGKSKEELKEIRANLERSQGDIEEGSTDSETSQDDMEENSIDLRSAAYDMEKIHQRMEKEGQLSKIVQDSETGELRTWSDELQIWKDAEDFVELISKLYNGYRFESIDAHLLAHQGQTDSLEPVASR